MHDLEQLLSTPLPQIKEDDFSIRIIENIRKQQRKISVIVSCMFAFVAIFFIILIPKVLTIGFSLFNELTAQFEIPEASSIDFSPLVGETLAAIQTPTGVLALGSLLIVSCLMKFDS